MAKKEKYDVSDGNKSFENEKKRKGVVLPFLLCLLVAVIVWLYASAVDEKEAQGSVPSETSLSAYADGVDAI